MQRRLHYSTAINHPSTSPPRPLTGRPSICPRATLHLPYGNPKPTGYQPPTYLVPTPDLPFESPEPPSKTNPQPTEYQPGTYRIPTLNLGTTYKPSTCRLPTELLFAGVEIHPDLFFQTNVVSPALPEPGSVSWTKMGRGPSPCQL